MISTPVCAENVILTEAFPWHEASRYLIRDRDGSYGAAVTRRLRAMGIRDKPIAPGSPWQNMAVAMSALEAQIDLLAPNQSTRRVAIDDFYGLPGSTPHIETVLRHGEMITAVILPPPPPGRQRYRKVRDRASYEFALISVAVIIAIDRETITSARVAFGGVAHRPWRSIDAEAALKGRPATLTTYQAAADAAMRSAVGRGHNDFKIELAKRTLCRTLADAAQISIGRPS